ncbi:thiamine pyrophosphate-binding protein [Bacteroides ovatus]|mgnify:FL=1|uniref:thiamine pyrophosphate-binding protein n=1 Tax=Bacteroides ovatus TaxID=28116 RepID=UPI00110581A0|nr:thiamine pyrophosphate-binding protein [Bacteroides ovatus]
MKECYSIERNVQIVIALLKAYNIKKIIASPGSSNIPFVCSAQNDPYFEMYSCVDERSAAYMACGLSAESGEPVVLTCTGATASRNYFSGLTEAFYRRLPIIALTSTRPLSFIGNHIAQVIDRTVAPNDIVKLSVFAPLVKDSNDEWDCQLKVNRALIALKKDGGGPVHINLETNSSFDFSVQEIKNVHAIQYVTVRDTFPILPKGRIAIFVGSHTTFTQELTTAIDAFCESNNGVVYCDQTSNYRGKYRIMSSLLGCQDKYKSVACYMDLLIYIGDICGAYESVLLMPKAKTVWRVCEDGIIRDPSHSLSKMFYMQEVEFFTRYIEKQINEKNLSFYNQCKQDYDHLYSLIPTEIPFSNIWMAYVLAPHIPKGSVMHYAILNSLRAWNFFETPRTVRGYSNVGGFGIDGNISALIGASLCDKNRLYFGIVGDLAFFYDMNVLGNRHVGNNIRILLINNGKGMEFRNYTHPVSRFSDTLVDQYMAGAGHFGKKSISLVCHYAEDLGYEYIAASNKEEFSEKMKRFLIPEITDKPIIFEVFTEQDDENEALRAVRNLEKSTDKIVESIAKRLIVNVAGEEGLEKVKKIIRGR